MKKLETKNQKVFQKLALFSKYDSILKTSSYLEVRFKKVSQSVFFPTKIENLQFFLSMRRMAMGVGVFESPDPGAPSRYLKHILLSSRKFFRGL